ncbi:hypothetical protein ABBQ32_000595 [Trebouxia sp. C0010 RCD-2024]
MRSCACRAQQQRHKSGKKAGFSMLPWFLAVPAAVAEEVTEQAQGAVEQAQGVLEQGKQAVEQAQQQFQLPSDLQYPSGSGVKIPKELPSASGLEDYISQNPAIVSAGVAVVAIGLLIARLVGQGVTAKKITAAKAFDMLSKDDSITFVDLRSKAELNETGSPDLRSIKRKTISLPYTTGLAGDLIEGFPDMLLKTPGLTEESTVIFFDTYGVGSKAVAGAVREGVKQVYWVADGAEGVRGWRASQLPWREPSRGFNFNFGGLGKGLNIDKIAEDFKSKPTLTKGALAVGALGAAAVVLFNEVEIVLEVLGVAAAGNFLAKKLLFAKDRDQTVDQIRDIVNNKIAAGEVGDDLRKVASTLSDTVTQTERTVEKKISPQVKKTYSDVKQGVKKAVAQGKDKLNSLESDAESATKDLQKSADKTGSKAQKQAESVQDKGKNIGKDIKSEAKSASKDAGRTAEKAGSKLQSQAESASDKGKDVGKDVRSQAKSANKDASKAVDKTADKAQSKAEDVGSQGKQAGQEVKSQVGSAGKQAGQAADQAGSKAKGSAQQAQLAQLQAKSSSAGDEFQKRKDEVIGESKENIKEAENTLKSKGSANGSSSGPTAPSQDDVKQQANEARRWIQDWRKKQPVKANA